MRRSFHSRSSAQRYPVAAVKHLFRHLFLIVAIAVVAPREAQSLSEPVYTLKFESTIKSDGYLRKRIEVIPELLVASDHLSTSQALELSEYLNELTFFINGTKVATLFQYPFSYSWTTREFGDYTVYGEAKLKRGASIRSNEVAVKIEPNLPDNPSRDSDAKK